MNWHLVTFVLHEQFIVIYLSHLLPTLFLVPEKLTPTCAIFKESLKIYIWRWIKKVNRFSLQRCCNRRTAKPRDFLNNSMLGIVVTSRCQVQLVFCLFTNVLKYGGNAFNLHRQNSELWSVYCGRKALRNLKLVANVSEMWSKVNTAWHRQMCANKIEIC